MAVRNGTKQRFPSRIAETARLERAQGGQPQAHDSGDPNINRVPRNKPDRIDRPSAAHDDDMPDRDKRRP